MKRFITTFARYVAAIIVAFVMSIIVFFLFGAIWSSLPSWEWPEAISVIAFNIVLAVGGFAGVFTGSLCLEQPGRRAGSIILLVLGLAFCIFMMVYFMDYDWNHEVPPYFLGGLGALGLGGLAAVIWFFRRRPKMPSS